MDPEFLFAENILDEFGFLRYIYHTQKPRALILIDYDGETEELKVIDEIDPFDSFPKEEIDAMMERLKAFWYTYKVQVFEEVEESDPNAVVKTPELDDAYTLSIINGIERPEPSDFALMDGETHIKMSINKYEFWARVIEYDMNSETIFAVVESYLEDQELKSRDSFMAQFNNVWAIALPYHE